MGTTNTDRIVESGFDGIPAARRAKAHEMHEQGWVGQIEVDRGVSRQGRLSGLHGTIMKLP